MLNWLAIHNDIHYNIKEKNITVEQFVIVSLDQRHTINTCCLVVLKKCHLLNQQLVCWGAVFAFLILTRKLIWFYGK